MEYITQFWDFIKDTLTVIPFENLKGDHATWAQSLFFGFFLNLRLIIALITLIFFRTLLKTDKRKIVYFFTFIFVFFTCCEIANISFRRDFEARKYELNYYNENTDNLVIIMEGANWPLTDYIPNNKTQIDVTRSRDLDALGGLEKKLTNKNTTVLTYVGSHSFNLSPQEVYTTVKYFRMFKPNGKVVLVGHSLGGYNVCEVLDKLSLEKKQVDLVIFIDNASKKYNAFDYTVKDNVKYAINFTSEKWADGYIFFTNAGGQISKDKTNTKTEYVNIPIKNTTHTSIDNKIANNVGDIVSNYLSKEENPIKSLKK
jgi:hypothetical protein